MAKTLTSTYTESHDRLTVMVKFNDAGKSKLRINCSRYRDSMSGQGPLLKQDHMKAIMPVLVKLRDKCSPGHAMKAIKFAFDGAETIEAGLAVLAAYSVESVKADPRFQHGVK